MSYSAKAQFDPGDKAALFTAPLQYICYKTATPVHCDGKLSESEWAQVPWTEDFRDIEGDSKPKPYYRTRAKMLWDDNYLYIAAEMDEEHIWAYLSERDAIVYHEHDFEVFVNPDGSAHHYYEIEINARQNIFDLYMDKPYRNWCKAKIDWNADGLKTGIDIDGSLNNPSDKDRKWTVEMAIPFKSLSLHNSGATPAPDTYWRLNFSRVEWDIDTTGGVYKKQLNPDTQNPKPEHNWVWSPQGIVNMHFPERWGYLWFTDSKAGEKKSYTLPFSEEMKQYLWLIYYREQDYLGKHKRYATRLKDLGIEFAQPVLSNQDLKLNLTTKNKKFRATVTCPALQITIHIDQEGEITYE